MKKYENRFFSVYYEKPRERWYAFTVESAGGESEANICARAFGWSIYIHLPEKLLKPHKVLHKYNDTCKQTNEVIERTYFEIFPNEYGFSLYEDGISFRYGPQTHDSTTTKSKYYRIPWLSWRFHAHRILDLDQNVIFEMIEGPNRRFSREKQRKLEQARKTVSKAKFSFADYDEELIFAECYIEEREWRFGESWCWWLQLFKKPIIRREMNIEYDREVGSRKGSWKGGTIGTSCNINQDQAPTDAFIFHCLKNNLTFLQKI